MAFLYDKTIFFSVILIKSYRYVYWNGHWDSRYKIIKESLLLKKKKHKTLIAINNFIKYINYLF